MKKITFYFLTLLFFITINNTLKAEQRSSITQYGITWTFNGQYECGQFVTGDWWVVGPVTINSVSPNQTAGRNGSCLDPLPGRQGYDDRGFAGTKYSTADRVAFPCTLLPNQSLVSSISKPESVTDFLNVGNLDAQAVLTVVGSSIAAGTLRPAYAGTYKKYFNTSELQMQILPDLPMPSANLQISWTNISGQDLVDFTDRPRIDHLGTWVIQHGCAEENWNNGPGTYQHHCYGQQYSELISKVAMYAMLNTPEKTQLVYNIVQFGIDNYGVIRAGGNWSPDGGHHSGRKFPIVFAAKLLNDADMLQIGSYTDRAFGDDGQTYYGVNGTSLWGQDDPNDNASYFLNGCSGSGRKDERDPAHLVDGCPDYRNGRTSPQWVGQMLATLMIDGKSTWNHDAYFDYVDRWMAADVDGGGSSGSSFIDELWDTYRDNLTGGSATVNVTGVNIVPTSIILNVGENSDIDETIVPSNATNKNVAWSSSNTSVATVDQSGLVTGIATGTAVISVTTSDGGYVANCSVVINEESSNSELMMYTGPGIEITDIDWPENHGDASVCLWGEDKVAALSLGVDDNTYPDHAWWLSMQQKYDFRMTWWVVTSGLNSNSNPAFNGTWADYQNLFEEGNEIASHSCTHDCNMTVDDYDWQLGDSKADIEAAIPGCIAKTYAGPCGNEAPQTITEKYYIAQRGTTGGTNPASGSNYNSSTVISSSPTTVFDPAEILTPGLNTWRAKYRGWRIHFFHYLQGLGDNVETNILEPMHANRDKLWVAPYGTVAMYAQERDSHTLTVVSINSNTITFNLTDQMDNTYFDYPLLVKIRVNNDWTDVIAMQNGSPVNASLVTHDGNKYVLVNAVPDRGIVSISTDAVIVNIPVTGVSVALSSLSLDEGQTSDLTETISPVDASNKNVTWSSSDNSIATVNSVGLVTAVSDGTANITVTTVDGGYTANCTVTVNPYGTSPSNVALNKTIIVSAAPEPDNGGSNLINGDTSDRWASSGFPQWAEIDLGEDYDLSSIELFTYQSRDYQYVVEAKPDGGSYSTIVDRSSNTEGANLIDAVSTTVRYVKITVSGANTYTGTWCSLNELIVIGELPTVISSRTETIVASNDDQEVRSNATSAWIGQTTHRVGGAGSGYDGCSVHPFALPSLSVGESIISANLDVYLKSISGTPGGNIDVYGLPFRSSSSVDVANDYWQGAYDTDGSATAIQDDFITLSSTEGAYSSTTVSGGEAFAAYINAQYAAGAQAGDYVFIRLNPDIADVGNYAFWEINSANNANNKPVLELEIGTGAPVNVPVTGINISTGSLSLHSGQTGQLTAAISPTDATNGNVSWSSSNTSIANIDANGLVSAVAQGNAIITVTTDDGGFTADCSVTVTEPVTGISVSPTDLSIEAGATSALTETISPADASDKSVSWASSNESVATVNASGLVSAVSEGQATITVTTNDGNFTAICTVTVTVPQYRTESITASTDDIEIRSYGGAAYVGQSTIRVGGAGSGYDGCAVFPFQLPALNPGDIVESANFTVNLKNIANNPAGNVDVYGLTYRSASTVSAATDYWQGSYGNDPNSTAIQDDFATLGSPIGNIVTDAAGNQNLADYINAQYASGAQAGNFVFIRLNPDVSDVTNYYYWEFYSANSSYDPVLEITIHEDASKSYIATSKRTIQLNAPQVSIFPNPACKNNILTIQTKGFKSNDLLNLKVYDISGRVIYSAEQFADKTGYSTIQVQTGNLNKGAYILSLGNGLQAVKTKLIID